MPKPIETLSGDDASAFQAALEPHISAVLDANGYIATAEQVAQAALAAQQAVASAATLTAAPRQGGPGTVQDSEGGPHVVLVPAGLARAFTIASVNEDGTLLATLFTVDTQSGNVTISNPKGAGGLQVAGPVTGQSLSAGAADLAAGNVIDGQVIFAPPAGNRFAWGLSGVLFYDSVDEVLRVPAARVADENQVPGALVRRGYTLGIGRMARPTQFLLPAGYVPVVKQGAAMRSKGLRTHQLTASLAVAGGWLYAMYDAMNSPSGLGAAYPADEAYDSYIVLARRPLAGGSWTEIAQIVPSSANARVFDPKCVTLPDGRLAVIYRFIGLGPNINKNDNYTTGAWISILENPAAPDGSTFVFGQARFLGHGDPQKAGVADGNVYLTLNVPRVSSFYDSTFTNVGRLFVTPGTKLCRLVTSGPGAPYVEPLSLLPGETAANTETYPEMQAVRLNAGADYDWYSYRRTTQGVKESWGSESPDGSITWTAPASATSKFLTSVAVRMCLMRTAMGNILHLGNQDSVNRRSMGLLISTDEATTFGHGLVIEDNSASTPFYPTSYPDAACWVDPATGRAKIAIAYDEGRGVGSGVPANIWCHEFFEDELLAGTVTTSASEAARVLISGLAYTGS